MPLWIKLVLLGFSVYRLSSLIASEEGPYLFFISGKDARQTGIFKWLRQKAGAEDYAYTYDKDGNQYREPLTNLGRGISCPLCTAGYVGFLLTFFIFSENIILKFFLIWFGVWGFQTFLENLTSDEAIAEAIEDS